MKSISYSEKKCWLGRLEKGDDILASLTRFCHEHSITVGTVSAIGAVQEGGVGFYDQKAAAYREIRFSEEMEIASLSGNISRKDGETFLHCHVILADVEGKSFGGHLLEGNLAFACEFVITEFAGSAPERVLDKDTGLMLW